MECQYPSSRIVTVISHPDSGNHYKCFGKQRYGIEVTPSRLKPLEISSWRIVGYVEIIYSRKGMHPKIGKQGNYFPSIDLDDQTPTMWKNTWRYGSRSQATETESHIPIVQKYDGTLKED
ncbi:hypothetical protein Tco_1235480 [Tanacetum coccineum]